MKPLLLFPSKFRHLGYLLAVPGFILGYCSVHLNYSIPGFELRLRSSSSLFLPAIENFTNELALTLVIVGLLLIAFSRVKCEDELTARIRLNALYWAILVNYGLCTLFVAVDVTALLIPAFRAWSGIMGAAFGFTIYNFFTPLLIFIARFYYLLHRNKHEYAVKPVRYLPNSPYANIGKWLSIIFILLYTLGCIVKTAAYLQTSFYLLPLSLLLWVYSKEKAEDEYVSAIRLEAMQIAVYTNYGILLAANLLVYGLDFLMVQFVNLITIPLIFIAWFQYKLYRINKQATAKSI